MMSISVGKNLKQQCLFAAIVLLLLHKTAVAQKIESQDSLEEPLCQTNRTDILPPPYNIMPNLVCKRVWNSYVIRYMLTKDRILTVILSNIYTTGWVGIGFSKDGQMLGSSAMVGWINKQGFPRIKQYYLQGVTSDKIIPNKGELQLTNVPEAVALYEATIYLAFQIKLEKPRAKQNILLAFGTKYPTHYFHLTRHDDRISLQMDFSSEPEVDVKEPSMKRIRVHGLMGILGWGLFLPSGVIIARYFKHKDPLWFYLHISIQTIGYLLLIANITIGVTIYRHNDSTLRSHRTVGIFAMSLATLQVFAFLIMPEKETKLRKYWNWYHHWTGRLGLVFGMVNILLGIQIGNHGDEWKIGYGFLLCFTFVTLIILEILALVARREALAKARITTQSLT